ANRLGHDEYLCRHSAPCSVHARQQCLRDDSLQHERQLRSHLALLVRREYVNYSIDRLGRRVRVEGGEGEVTRLGNREARLDGLLVAHLTYEHHVRIFTQGVLERAGERLGVRTHLTLVDDAALVTVDELDGVFHRDDVPATLAIDLVDHGRKRGGLS